MLRSISRRAFLQASSLMSGGLTLPDLLRLRNQAAAAHQANGRAVVFVTLGGGPSQFETYDPKFEAPAEYRGEFHPIATSLPGVQFCELLPQQARLLDRIAIVRSVQHQQASHIAEHIVETGFDLTSSANALKGEMPSVGAVVSRVRGAGSSGIPAYVSLPRHHAYAGPHWLGAQHHYFAVNEDPNDPAFKVANLALTPGMTADRLSSRRSLQSQLDHAERLHDQSGQADSVDEYARQALQLITGDKARRAFDLNEESEATRDRYGRTTVGQRMLLARRLVEADVPFVTVRMGDWDDHQNLAGRIRVRAPQFDTAIAALINDLHERGMNREVLVVAMGEFGRTPRVNTTGGRDHFPAVNNMLIAGGEYRMGQVIGATDRNGARVTAAPYPPQSVLTMVYRHLGIDPSMTFNDYSGRPRHVLEERQPIVELL